MRNEDEVVLYDSDDAAKFVTGISGWVSRTGKFFGEDESLARWSGATHHKCESCDNIISIRGRAKCYGCTESDKAERYSKLEKVKWDGKTPIYCEVNDKYFFDESDLADFIENSTLQYKELRPYLCKPVKYSQLDEDFFQDDLCEERELDESLVKAIEEFNKAAELAPTSCWEQSSMAVYIGEME